MAGHSLDHRPVIIGAGLAGLMTALQLASEPVVLLASGLPGQNSSSIMAQGGLAAALGPDDAPDLHLADTLAAGDGVCVETVARRIIEAGADVVRLLEKLGVAFDRDAAGGILLGLEAAHGRRRIAHAQGDGTGREIIRALVKAARACPSIHMLSPFIARRLMVEQGRVSGVIAEGPDGLFVLRSSRVVLATGGVGGLYLETTNPAGSFGQGLALAAHAGAEFADLEFVQFHPTALDLPIYPLKLISEAVRGEGAVLIDECGARFMAGLPGAELAPRDQVARAIWRHIRQGHSVFLDARSTLGPRFAARFPGIYAACMQEGLDPSRDPVPVRPAAHYHMGGIAVDEQGRSTIEGLWACGEVASTGLHGANRLASNSLLEAAVTGQCAAQNIAGTPARAVRPQLVPPQPQAPDPVAVRPVMSRYVGVERDREGLAAALVTLLPAAQHNDAALSGLLIAASAYLREESRGAHYRSDFIDKVPAFGRSRITREVALDLARSLKGATSAARRTHA